MSARPASLAGSDARPFFLLPDEDAAAYASFEATWLATLDPHDLPERDAALDAIRALWRQMRADRLEALILADLFAANGIEDESERRLAKREGMRALSTLIRYRNRLQREHDQALARLDVLRARPDPTEPAPGTSEPDATAPASTTLLTGRQPPAPPLPVRPPQAGSGTAVPSEPDVPPRLNRQQRRALAAQARKAQRKAA